LLAVVEDKVVGVVVLEVRGDLVAAVQGIASPARLTRVTEQWRRSDHGDPILDTW
jgi:RNA polymerase sigma-70 factor (ECF subfamily)